MHLSRLPRSRSQLVVWAMVCWGLATSSALAQETDGDAQPVVTKFLAEYCVQCHAEGSAEGERVFDSFELPIDSQQGLVTADEIIDQVTTRRMPPEEADQPTDDERVAVVNELRGGIAQARDQFSSTGGHTVMRRLTQREYERTLETLFGRRVDTLGLTADFPKDIAGDADVAVGASLVTSGFLLDQYFQAASRLVETRLGKPHVEPQSWHFTDNFRQYEELTGSHRAVFNFEYLCLYEQPNTDTRQGGYGHIEDFLEGVPVSGLYDIEVHAQAMHRDTHYDPKIFRIDFSEPFQLAVVPGDVRKGHIHYPQAIEPILARDVVPDEEPEWLRFRVWLEAGQTPRFIFPNGPYESRASVIELNRRYKDEFENPQEGVSRTTLLREGALPHIRIGEIKIHGPLAEAGGSLEERTVFGAEGFQAEHAVEQLLAFAQRAYRRPLEPVDRDRIETFYQRRLSEDATPRQAALDSLKLILCSPSFLYLSEITPEDQNELNPFDLASRLSYALWGTPPDELLYAAAESKDLVKPDELKRQIVRLLDDERSSEFVDRFLDHWLGLQSIGNSPPPRTAAPEYYAENLPESMKEEVRQLFATLLRANGPATDLLAANYTFVDKRLAKLYGLPEKDTLRLADGFQRVDLDADQERGGLLGMAAVLTVSANGVETSPVTRGVWVLEKILGTPTPPPPDVVPAIDADVSGAESIRDKLVKHRADPACSVCHRSIDPVGFALEPFDPIGRRRTYYPLPNGRPSAIEIDASGTLPTGEAFEDLAEFKQILLEQRRDLFLRNLVEQLLTYATSRRMERVDRYEIEDVLAGVKRDGEGLQSLVIAALTSEIFRSR